MTRAASERYSKPASVVSPTRMSPRVRNIRRAPIDQWRFAYMYRQPLAEVKNMVQWLLSEEILTPHASEQEEETGDQQLPGQP